MAIATAAFIAGWEIHDATTDQTVISPEIGYAQTLRSEYPQMLGSDMDLLAYGWSICDPGEGWSERRTTAWLAGEPYEYLKPGADPVEWAERVIEVANETLCLGPQRST